MPRQNNVSAAQLLGWFTLGVCALSLFDPRFRKACFGLSLQVVEAEHTIQDSGREVLNRWR